MIDKMEFSVISRIGRDVSALLIPLYPWLSARILGNSSKWERKVHKQKMKPHMLLFHSFFKMSLSQPHIQAAKNSFKGSKKKGSCFLLKCSSSNPNPYDKRYCISEQQPLKSLSSNF